MYGRGTQKSEENLSSVNFWLAVIYIAFSLTIFSDSIVNIQSSKNTISKTNIKLTYLGQTQFGIFAEC